MSNFPNQIPIVNQFVPQFEGTAIAETVVEELNDLLNLTFNYEHKLVWVKSEESYYYLSFGDGSNISNWKQHKTDVNLEQWNPDKTYKQSFLVYYNEVIYQAKTNVPKNINPSKNENYWQIITGKTNYGYQIFRNQSEVIVNISDVIPITNNLPYFTIYVGELTNELNPDGTIKLNNMEIIEADIEKISNTEYIVRFFENNLPKELSGYLTYE